ncbi:hypothetical protein KZZ06_21430, partial [Sulfitobacter sp. CW3]|nr:hypothetical protein [Sulfitobacter sp. CW3]
LAAVWIAFVSRNRRSALMIATLVLGAAALLLLYPEAITERGSSYRFELWSMTLQRIAEHPFIGHSYDSELSLIVGGVELMEPHSF